MTIRAEMVGLLLVVAGPLIVSLPAVAGAASPTPVAQTTMTFVDSSRSTPAWGGAATKRPDPGDDHLVSGSEVRMGHGGRVTARTR